MPRQLKDVEEISVLLKVGDWQRDNWSFEFRFFAVNCNFQPFYDHNTSNETCDRDFGVYVCVCAFEHSCDDLQLRHDLGR